MSKLVEKTVVEGGCKPYLQIDRVECLVAMAQIRGRGVSHLELRPGTLIGQETQAFSR